MGTYQRSSNFFKSEKLKFLSSKTFFNLLFTIFSSLLKKWLYIWLKNPNRSGVNLEIDPIILDPGVYFNYFCAYLAVKKNAVNKILAASEKQKIKGKAVKIELAR